MQIGLGIPEKTVSDLLKLYSEELTHDVYSPSRAAALKHKRKTDREMLKSLDKLNFTGKAASGRSRPPKKPKPKKER